MTTTSCSPSEKGRGKGEGVGGGEHEEWNTQERGRTDRESKERNIVIEGAIKGLVRNTALGKFPGIHRDNPS